jgi:hypothetical protein
MSYNKQVNPYGIASSELGWRGFADGGRMSNPGAVAIKEPWWKEYAAKGIVATSGKLFDHLTLPTATDEVVGGAITKDANTAFDTYATSLGDQAFIDDRMKRTGETADQSKLWAAKELDSLSQRRKDLAAAYRAENPNYGSRVVDSKVDFLRPKLNPGYVYRSDLEDKGKKKFSFFDSDTWY